MPSERALIRRLRSLSYGGNQLGCAAPEAEVDRRRFMLAEELLKIRAEAGGYELTDEAPKCLAAAEIVYPELPADSDLGAQVSRQNAVEEAANG
jgi:hypothetical protein